MLCEFNDKAVSALSHPIVVAAWWVLSAATIIWTIVSPSMISGTLGLSFLALAYSSAIYERQIRSEQLDHARDQALHTKVDALINAVPDAPDTVAGIEPDRAD